MSTSVIDEKETSNGQFAMRRVIVLGDLLTVNAYDKSEHTFNVLGVLLTVNT